MSRKRVALAAVSALSLAATGLVSGLVSPLGWLCIVPFAVSEGLLIRMNNRGER